MYRDLCIHIYIYKAIAALHLGLLGRNDVQPAALASSTPTSVKQLGIIRLQEYIYIYIAIYIGKCYNSTNKSIYIYIDENKIVPTLLL